MNKVLEFVKAQYKCSREQPLYCASMVVIIVAIIILLHFLQMALFPIRAIEVNSVEVTTPVVEAGGEVFYTLDFCSYGQYPVTVNRRVVNGFVYSLPNYNTTTPSDGCYSSSIRGAFLPEETPPGEYFLQVELVIHVNSIRDIIIEYETDTFEVK